MGWAGSRAGLVSERGRGCCGLRGRASVAQRGADLWDLPVSGKGGRTRGLQAELSSGEAQAGPRRWTWAACGKGKEEEKAGPRAGERAQGKEAVGKRTGPASGRGNGLDIGFPISLVPLLFSICYLNLTQTKQTI